MNKKRKINDEDKRVRVVENSSIVFQLSNKSDTKPINNILNEIKLKNIDSPLKICNFNKRNLTMKICFENVEHALQVKRIAEEKKFKCDFYLVNI